MIWSFLHFWILLRCSQDHNMTPTGIIEQLHTDTQYFQTIFEDRDAIPDITQSKSAVYAVLAELLKMQLLVKTTRQKMPKSAHFLTPTPKGLQILHYFSNTNTTISQKPNIQSNLHVETSPSSNVLRDLTQDPLYAVIDNFFTDNDVPLSSALKIEKVMKELHRLKANQMDLIHVRSAIVRGFWNGDESTAPSGILPELPILVESIRKKLGELSQK